jgi:hypothetical protein
LKAKEERIKKMLMEAMATHELLTKNFLEIYLKKIGNLAFLDTLDFESNYGFKAHMLCNL